MKKFDIPKILDLTFENETGEISIIWTQKLFFFNKKNSIICRKNLKKK